MVLQEHMVILPVLLRKLPKKFQVSIDMNCYNIHEAVYSHNTNERPAIFSDFYLAISGFTSFFQIHFYCIKKYFCIFQHHLRLLKPRYRYLILLQILPLPQNHIILLLLIVLHKHELDFPQVHIIFFHQLIFDVIHAFCLLCILFMIINKPHTKCCRMFCNFYISKNIGCSECNHLKGLFKTPDFYEYYMR